MTTRQVEPVLSMALFVSDMPKSRDMEDGFVRETVEGTLRRLGADECYARAAQEYGDRPEVAVGRMQWAREVCERAFAMAGAAA